MKHLGKGPDVSFREIPFAALAPLWLAGVYVAWWTARTFPSKGWLGADGHAYWLTAHTHHLYSAPVGALNAFNYSPAFAQVVHPLALLPWPAFLAIWIALEASAFAWLLAPLGWRWAVPLWLCCSVAIGFANIWGMLTAAAVLAMQRPAVWAFAVLTKVTPGILMIWHLARREWRAFTVASASTLAIALVSYAIDPSAWHQWVAFLGENSGSASAVPARLSAAAILVIIAARRDGWRWLMAPAIILSCPHLLPGFPWITMLAAIPRLHSRSRAGQATAPTAGPVLAGARS